MLNPEIGVPSMLVVGASHVTHYKEFIDNPHVEQKYKTLFSRSFFLGVGGTDWESCLNHFSGINLSDRNKHLGDQWSQFFKSGIKPNYTLIILGSNSIDSFDRRVREIEQHSSRREVAWKRANTEMNARFNTLSRQVYTALNTIKHNAPYGEMLYVKVLPRSYWHQISRKLSDKIDFYINRTLRRRFHIKEIWAQELLIDPLSRSTSLVMPGMQKTDEVHLNTYGYKALTLAVLRPILSKWLNLQRRYQLPQNAPKPVVKTAKKKRRGRKRKTAGATTGGDENNPPNYTA